MTFSPFDQLKPLAGRALEAALNRALALDPETRSALTALDGRRVALALESPPLALEVRVNGEQLSVGPVDAATAPDLAVRTTLTGALSQLTNLLGGESSRAAATPVGRVHVTGDAELARHLQRLVERFDPDWQQPFTRIFGDVLGMQMANVVAGAFKQARSTVSSFAESAAEYVTEESRDVVGKAELNAFHDDVDMLRDEVERLSARLARMRQRDGEAA